MSTPRTDYETERDEATEDAEADRADDRVRFATFYAHNAAAVHLLETVQASAASASLVSDEDTFAYDLVLPSPNNAGASQPAASRWRIGSGPSAALAQKRVACCTVDLLLCPPGNSPGARRARGSIKSIHAVIYFHPESGVLVLRNVRDKPIVYQNGDVNANDFPIFGGVKGHDSCVLFRERNHLRFGDYEFVLEFNLDPRQLRKFRAQRDALLSRNHSLPSRHLAAVPAKDHFRCWNVRIHHKIPQGSQGSRGSHSTVYCGVHLHTGKPVAVKIMRYEKETQQRVRRELSVASLFSKDCTGVLGMLESWCEHSGSPPCRLEKCETPEDHEDVFYSMPLAEYDFETMPWTQLDFEGRIGYLYQTLCGLGQFHDREMIHGRIRPRSLMILPDPKSSASSPTSLRRLPTGAALSPAVSAHNYDKPRAAIWVAPEVWTSTEDDPYTTKADIWAIAASWLTAFVHVVKDKAIDKRSYRALLKTLDAEHEKGKITGPFRSLLLRMLAWDPDDRPSVEDALAHEAWAPVKRRIELQENHDRRDREDRIRGPDNGVKKVRLLSPEAEPASRKT